MKPRQNDPFVAIEKSLNRFTIKNKILVLNYLKISLKLVTFGLKFSSSFATKFNLPY
jgi:hypothetical protein